jgi:hypothetical protein
MNGDDPREPPSPPPPELVEYLRRELNFLWYACRIYDGGYEEIAVKVAVSIRVLAHDTKNSTSLLTQLGRPIQLLSTVPTSPPINRAWLFIGTLSSVGGAKQLPILDGQPNQHHFLPWQEWWVEPVYALRELGHFSRRDIVLPAANKDGGAHVDLQDVPEAYTVLREGVVRRPGTETNEAAPELTNNQFPDLRQIAHELLRSPDIVSLAGAQARS